MPGLHQTLCVLAGLSASILLSILPAFGTTVSQIGGYSSRVWGMRDGLPQDQIQTITQTRDGYLWIGTSEGLARFDGVRFVVFNRSNTPAFGDDSVVALLPARDGSLWIGTEGGGLLQYFEGSFRSFGTDEGLTNGFVRAIHEDRRGVLWVGTDRGLFQMDSSRLVRRDGTAEVPWASVLSISEDDAGRIWFSGAKLVFAEGDRLYPYQSPSLESVTRFGLIYKARNGDLWLVAETSTRRVRDGVVLEAAPKAVPRGVYPWAILEDSVGNVWIGAPGQGLIRSRDGAWENYRAPGVVPHNTVLSLYEDAEQNIWIGTQDGLLQLSPKTVSTLTIYDGLADDNVSTIFEDRSGILWVTTQTGLVYRLAEGRLTPFSLPGIGADIPIRTVFEDSKGVFWLGTDGDGVVRLERGRAVSYTTGDGLRNNYIRAIYEDRTGRLWIGTDSGVSRWDGKGFHNYYVQDGLPYGSVRAIVEDQNGDLLVGTDRGAGRIRGTSFITDPALDRLKAERIWTIHQDPDGVLWLGARGGGLLRIKNGALARFTTAEGLPNNNIYQVLEDGGGDLWISSAQGIFRVNRSELNAFADGKAHSFTVLPYGNVDGLESSHMNGGVQFAGCRASDGSLWFPTVKGAVRVDPDDVRVSRQPPALIESMIADERPVDLTHPIRIAPGRGNLRVQYTAINLRSPERIQFKYKLEGFDEAWTLASNRRVAYYTNLRPGDYRFRVVADDSAAADEPHEASLSFTWRPHFYQATWFYGLCGVLVIASVVAGVRFHAAQTEARYQLRLAERGRLAREMHDTVIQGCVGVSTLLEAAAGFRQSNPEAMTDLLNRARAQIRLTLQEARQAVWDLRQTSLEHDVIADLSEFASELEKEKGIPIMSEIAGTPVPLGVKYGRGLLLVIKEALRNAASHAQPDWVRWRLCFEPGEVRLEVVDNGCGFECPAELSLEGGHYGLIGMRERVEQLGGHLEIRSVRGGGTQVTAAVPLPPAAGS